MSTQTIEIPDPTRGRGYSKAGDGFRVRFWVNGSERRRMLSSRTPRGAKQEAQDFFRKMLEEEGATIRPRKKNVPTKLKPGLYVYERDPFFVRIGNKQVGTGKTREAAEEVRDAFLKKLR
jgi:hypothetical protein|tara:strand:- start:1198 stop:1557 length:360 start_codon:yes stop_codon:yes gene_type:complete